MGLKLAAATLLLVLLGSEISSFRLKKRDAPAEPVLTQLQEAAKGYWDQVSNTTQSWFGHIKSFTINEKLSDMYEKGSSAVSTYLSIISDQLYHHWHGDQ